jgi:hypothetical protein
MNTTDRHIWFFKEARSGSEWLWKTLEGRLQKKCYSVDPTIFAGKNPIQYESVFNDNINELSNATMFYATHYFPLLREIKKLDNPYLIRSTRRDKAEHCMSLLYFGMFTHPFHHFYVDPMENARYAHFLRTLEKPVLVLKQEVLKEMQKIQRYDSLWREYSKDYENYVIVYEDLIDGVNLPLLEDPLKFSDNETFVKKTPNYKEKFFINYEQIIEWCKYYEKELGLDTF